MRAFSVESPMPARSCTAVPGNQTAAPEYADVPPNRAVFSSTIVLNPLAAAVYAPVRAPPPDPTTSTSHRMVQSCIVIPPWGRVGVHAIAFRLTDAHRVPLTGQNATVSYGDETVRERTARVSA